MWCSHWNAWAVDKKVLRESLYRAILGSLFHLLKGMSVRMEHATASSSSSDGVEVRLQELRSSAVTRGREWLQDALAQISVMEIRRMAQARNAGRGPDKKWFAVEELRARLLDILAPRTQVRWGRIRLWRICLSDIVHVACLSHGAMLWPNLHVSQTWHHVFDVPRIDKQISSTFVSSFSVSVGALCESLRIAYANVRLWCSGSMWYYFIDMHEQREKS